MEEDEAEDDVEAEEEVEAEELSVELSEELSDELSEEAGNLSLFWGLSLHFWRLTLQLQREITT